MSVPGLRCGPDRFCFYKNKITKPAATARFSRLAMIWPAAAITTGGSEVWGGVTTIFDPVATVGAWGRVPVLVLVLVAVPVWMLTAMLLPGPLDCPERKGVVQVLVFWSVRRKECRSATVCEALVEER